MRRSEAPSQAQKAEKRIKYEDPLMVLSKPFQIPFFSRNQSTKRTRRRATENVDYREKENIDPDDPAFNIGYSRKKGTIVRVLSPEEALSISFRTPLKERQNELATRPRPSLGLIRQADIPPTPLHDPGDEFAIVLYDPTTDDEPMPVVEEIIQSQDSSNKGNSKKEITGESIVISSRLVYKRFKLVPKDMAAILGVERPDKVKKEHPKVPVVADPKLAKVLRPHQVEGLQFMYRCVTGRVKPGVHGCIMADEMGLGKTLQCIALLWTLLKQSPEGRKGEIEKCLITCPASLVSNWANELVKWLGKGAIAALAIDGKSIKGAVELAAALRRWSIARGRQVVMPVLIVSYETLRDNAQHLEDANIGLMLCDEGHRLKNSDNMTYKVLNAMDVKRRVVLSGTPIQNNLKEYFSLLSFAIPDLVGSPTEFKKNYGNHITRARDADATEQDIEIGDQKLQELSTLVSSFIIRRTNDLLTKFLPRKYEHVVFCELSPFQRALYNVFIKSEEVRRLLREQGNKSTSSGTTTLQAITLLKKLCNHPDLIDLPRALPGSEECFPDGYVPVSMRGARDRDVNTVYSGKFQVLERMLATIRAQSDDKIVIISNYTETLNLVEKMCRTMRYGVLRLDGTMTIKKRQKYVDQFNDPEGSEFIFLLSSKAGGCGINLIGANRLILLDPDWNPASDQQALARVWRDGQKKHCFVYRFIATGSIEEKVFQRQSAKQSLSATVVDEKEDVERVFSTQDLRQLFKVQNSTPCDTHDTFKCKRCKDGVQVLKAPAMLYGDTTTWNHFAKSQLHKIEDHLLQNEAPLDVVSYVFQYISH